MNLRLTLIFGRKYTVRRPWPTLKYGQVIMAGMSKWTGGNLGLDTIQNSKGSSLELAVNTDAYFVPLTSWASMGQDVKSANVCGKLRIAMGLAVS